MPLVSMTDMLNKALEGKYAVGQFNINNLEWTQAILGAAQEEQSPVILGVSEGAARHMGGFYTVVKMVEGLVHDMKITVPVAIHLDHGSSVEKCKEAIDAGFTSVMIDDSHSPIDTNIETTKAVVEYAHAKGVSVEAEVGTVGGQEDDVIGDVMYAKLDECVRIVKETGIDTLAPALGSVHHTKVNQTSDSKKWKKSVTQQTSHSFFTVELEFRHTISKKRSHSELQKSTLTQRTKSHSRKSFVKC